MLTFSILTLFPELLRPFATEALLGKAQARDLIEVNLINMRDFSENKHQKVDDTPYGGGAGMVIRADVIERALASVLTSRASPDEVILFTPAGEPMTQQLAEELALKPHLVLLCGRYEGFDARAESLATREVSMGDFVLMGGEAAAACLLEAVARLVPEVLGDAESHQNDSFSSGLLDYPEYTRPPEWQGQYVPEVLLSGHHGHIATWRREQALTKTFLRRPDLLETAELTPEDTEHLMVLGATPKQLEQWNAPKINQKRKRRKT